MLHLYVSLSTLPDNLEQRPSLVQHFANWKKALATAAQSRHLLVVAWLLASTTPTPTTGGGWATRQRRRRVRGGRKNDSECDTKRQRTDDSNQANAAVEKAEDTTHTPHRNGWEEHFSTGSSQADGTLRLPSSMDRHPIRPVRQQQIVTTSSTTEDVRTPFLLRCTRFQHHSQRRQLSYHASRHLRLFQAASSGQTTHQLHQPARKRQHTVHRAHLTPLLGVHEERIPRSPPLYRQLRGGATSLHTLHFTSRTITDSLRHQDSPHRPLTSVHLSP